MADKDKRVASALVLRYLALEARFEPALDDLKIRTKAHPDVPAPPVMVALVAELRDQAFRIVSRERFGRPLARLRPDSALSFAQLLLCLEEVEVALAAFKALYYKQIDDDDGDWWSDDEP